MTRREFTILDRQTGETRITVLEAGRWYGLDGLPWHIVGELSRMVEVTTADVTAAERGGYRWTEINGG
jgi:hypothetical protein